MYRHLFALFVLSSLWSCSPKNTSLAEKVNPFIGTGGHGHTYPGAAAPFGFMQLSPDTRLDGWDGCGGYHYSDSVIYGFSHSHLSGTGISDYGDVLIMPFTGPSRFNNGALKGVDNGYASRFNHQNESAHAGYYKVLLDDYNIEVELSASDRSGMHHYRFNTRDTAAIIIDLEHRDQLLDHSLKLVDEQHIQGYRISKAWAQKQFLYFDLALSQPSQSAQFNSDTTKLILRFNAIDELLIKTGISAVSTEGALANRESEIPHWDFHQLKAETEEKWNKELAKIRVEMNSAEEEQIFYTAAYHSYLNPNIFKDSDGKYRGTDLKIHQSENHVPYTVFSLWDTYRATHPLFTITQVERSKAFIRTFLDQYQKGGKLPMWELAGNYTGCMIGYHAVPVIVDAYMKGIVDFDANLALEAMLSTANADELGKAYWEAYGYMASDEEHESVSKNLEYAYNDWCIAVFARALGKDSIYRHFIQRAQNYQNIFDPATGFMRAKRKQMFLEPFDPAEVNFNFTEANAWQYSFYVPHDVEGLIKLHGGKNNLAQKLDELFTAEATTSGRKQADITGLIGQYAHGNEPSHHMAYLYNYVDASSKSQLMVRRLLKEMYRNEPDGLIGNEDCGQMSSWYVLSALGFYPLNPGSPEYAIGSPLVKSAQIKLENGKAFNVKVLNQGADNPYIQSISWQGEPYTKAWISHDMIMSGGELSFTMGPKPGPVLQAPKSAIEEELVTAVPYIIKESENFRDSLVLRLACAEPDAKIYYSLRGNRVDSNSTLYEEPIVLRNNSMIYAIAKSANQKRSKMIGSVFVKLKTNRSVVYSEKPDPQYAGEGDFSLFDGHRGGSDFRTGTWQAWQGKNLELEIDLGSKGETVSEISTSHIQDIKSWIFLPKEVRFYGAFKADEYEFLGAVKPMLADTVYGAELEKLRLNISARKLHKIRIEIEAYGPLPKWHISAGEASWMFMDEVFIR
ncbi:MAG: GH92 family glycosyl hydrolase [Bacteroidetes bacterium]|nr:GH92 family glycosyl hydrolase [Bacteroidota bacterium]